MVLSKKIKIILIISASVYLVPLRADNLPLVFNMNEALPLYIPSIHHSLSFFSESKSKIEIKKNDQKNKQAFIYVSNTNKSLSFFSGSKNKTKKYDQKNKLTFISNNLFFTEGTTSQVVKNFNSAIFSFKKTNSNIPTSFNASFSYLNYFIYRQLDASVNYNFQMKISRYKAFSFGIKGGFTNGSKNFNSLDFVINEPNVINNENETYPIIGLGVSYVNRLSMISLGIPNFIQDESLFGSYLKKILFKNKLLQFEGYISNNFNTSTLVYQFNQKIIFPKLSHLQIGTFYQRYSGFGISFGRTIQDIISFGINLSISSQNSNLLGAEFFGSGFL